MTNDTITISKTKINIALQNKLMELGYEPFCDLAQALYETIDGLNDSKWIPCSERLPSDTAIHEVTAQFSNGTIYTEFAYYDESREEWWKFDDDGMVNVVAWKEGSEPYKGE